MSKILSSENGTALPSIVYNYRMAALAYQNELLPAGLIRSPILASPSGPTLLPYLYADRKLSQLTLKLQFLL